MGNYRWEGMVRGAMFSFITRRDHRIMRHVNRWPAPRWIRVWMLAATRAGDGWLWYALGIVILLFGGEQRIRAVAAAVLAEGVGVALFLCLKKSANRKRPCAYEQHCWATLLPPDQFSFPSGHTITAFALAVSLTRFYPNLAPGLLFCAISIAASRVVLGMHFLSDVLVGAAIGTALAFATTHLIRLL
jgi:undecaprenyl-diphosphatase